jgi:hypothetical protein
MRIVPESDDVAPGADPRVGRVARRVGEVGVVGTGNRRRRRSAVDAFAGLQRRWPSLRDERKALAYVRMAVINRCRSVVRRRRIALRFAQPAEPPVWSAESDVILREDRRAVLRALNGLPRRRREVLVMRYYLDLDYAEIAAARLLAPLPKRVLIPLLTLAAAAATWLGLFMMAVMAWPP